MNFGSRDDFHNAFVIEKSGEQLWNVVELARIVSGSDTGAPTIPNLLRRLAKHFMDTSTIYARSGAKLQSLEEAKHRKEQIETLADEIRKLADSTASTSIRYEVVEKYLSDLRSLGKFAPDSLVSNVAHAFRNQV